MLLQIKDDSKNIISKEKIEIDYLRKLRIKTKVKSIFMALCFIFIILFTYYLIKFIKINNIINKAAEFSKLTNYYREIIALYNDGRATSIKQYCKDGQYKEVIEAYSDEGVEKLMEIYGLNDSNEIITIDLKNNIAIIEKGQYAEIMNNSKVINRKNLFEIIQRTFTTSITTDNYDIGKEYYVIRDCYDNNNRNEKWVDKDTELILTKVKKMLSKHILQVQILGKMLVIVLKITNMNLEM